MSENAFTQARHWLNELRDDALAEEDDDAAARYADFMTAAVDDFLSVCNASPSRFRALARSRECWPMMHNAHAEDRKAADRDLASLDLGAQSELNFHGKTFSKKTPANQIVLKLYRIISGMRGDDGLSRQVRLTLERFAAFDDWIAAYLKWEQETPTSLPPLERDTAAEWHRKTWPLFLFLFGEEFDLHPRFNTWAKGKERCHRRDAIKRAIKQAWHSIARDSV